MEVGGDRLEVVRWLLFKITEKVDSLLKLAAKHCLNFLSLLPAEVTCSE